jgi:hypothetical protein
MGRADRYQTGDLFTLQNEITSRIASALNLELTAIEAVRPTEHLDTLDYILRGRAALWKPPTRESYAEAIILFERAVALEPTSVEAQSWLASALAWRMLDGITDAAAADIARAEGSVGQALVTSSRSPVAHFAKGSYCERSGGQRKPSPSTKWRSRLVATGRTR